MKKKLTFLGLFIAVCTVVFIYTKSFPIHTITCESQVGACPKELTSKLADLSGRPRKEVLSSLDNMLSESILVKEYAVHFVFPRTVEIKIVQRTPYYGIRKKGDDTSWVLLVDDTKKALQIVDSTDLPVVVTQDSLPNPGSTIEDRLFFALDLLYDLSTYYQIKTGEIVDDSFEIYLSDGKKVIFPLEGDRRVLLGSLYLVVNWLNTEGKDTKMDDVDVVHEIDLRYKNPVLR